MELNLKHLPEPQYARNLAEVCVDAAERVSGLKLDYSVESLRSIEEELDSFIDQGQKVAQIASTLFCFGCYVGETMITNLGGRWVRTEGSKLQGLTSWPMVVELDNGDCWNPIGKVFKYFEARDEEDLSYFFNLAASGRS